MVSCIGGLFSLEPFSFHFISIDGELSEIQGNFWLRITRIICTTYLCYLILVLYAGWREKN